MLAYQGMKDSYRGNEEVAAVRAQVCTPLTGKLPPDVAAQAKALDAKLATFGGAVAGARRRRRRRRPRRRRPPGAMQSFVALNNAFNTMRQHDAGRPGHGRRRRAQIDTWESDCSELQHDRGGVEDRCSRTTRPRSTRCSTKSN